MRAKLFSAQACSLARLRTILITPSRASYFVPFALPRWRSWTPPSSTVRMLVCSFLHLLSTLKKTHTYGRPNCILLDANAAPAPTMLPAIKPPAPAFNARVKTDPSEAVNVPAAPANMAAVAAALAARSAVDNGRKPCSRRKSSCVPKTLIPAPIAPAINALRAAASFFDVLEFCGAFCGDGVCGDGVCPRDEIDIAFKRPLPHVLGDRLSIFLVFCFVFCAPRKATHFFGPRRKRGHE